MATFEHRHEPGDQESVPGPEPGHMQPLQDAGGIFITPQQIEDESPWTWGRSPWDEVTGAPGEHVVRGEAPFGETSTTSPRPIERTEPAGGRLDASPLLEVARDLVKDTPEGRALKRKLEAFDLLGDAAKERAAPGIREDIADIVARAVTEEHQRTALLEALANFRNDPTVAVSEPVERREQHPSVAQLLDLVEDILAELGKEMLIEALLPGAHVLRPPTDFLDSVFTAVTMFKIAGPADWP